MVTEPQARQSGVWFLAEVGYFHSLSETSKLALAPIYFPIHCLLGVLFPWITQSGREVDHSPRLMQFHVCLHIMNWNSPDFYLVGERAFFIFGLFHDFFIHAVFTASKVRWLQMWTFVVGDVTPCVDVMTSALMMEATGFSVSSAHIYQTTRRCIKRLLFYDIYMIYMIWYDIWYDIWWYDMTWYMMIWYIYIYIYIYDVTWRDVTWRDMTWHEMTWHDMTWHLCTAIGFPPGGSGR